VTDAGATFLAKSRALLLDDYLPKIETCVAELGDDGFWWRPNESCNAVGNLLLHLTGNFSQWVLEGIGRQPYSRDRQQEFDERRPLARADVLGGFRRAIAAAADVIAAQTTGSLLERRRIQGYEVTVLDAIYHVVEHAGMHTGQIILIAKMRTGRDLRLWQPPSV
jgi:uncharacterized damage-inducible protein DinB